MKRKCPNSAASTCSSSSSSSCCIESPLIGENDHKCVNNKKKKKQPNNKRSSVRGSKKIVGGAGVDSSAATSPKSRSSIYRGVTRHRWTGRFEAHLWDKTTWNTIQNKRGRQIYLGAYDNEEDAARTYDLAALKYWGPGPASILNFPVERYRREVEEMEKMSKEEFLASLRRRSSGFSRGVSKYRGVARHHHNGRWEARIGRVCGNKYLYLGTYSTQEEAAAAYDRAAIEFRGPNAVTNFDISNYANKLKKVPSDVEVQVEHDDIQVKQEILNQVQEDDHQEDGNQVVQPSNIPKLEFNDSPATVVKEQFDKVQANDNQEQANDHQVEANQLVQTINILKFESTDTQDIVVVMDPIEEHEHPWDLCLDIGFNSLPIEDIPLEKSSSEVFGLLDDKGFEDDIEFIFDGQFSDREFLQDAISGTGECRAEADVLVGPDVSNSPSSSPLSTTTSVCSNI